MLISDNKEYMRAKDHLESDMPSIARVILTRAVSEYESANPPKPKVLPLDCDIGYFVRYGRAHKVQEVCTVRIEGEAIDLSAWFAKEVRP